MRIAELFHSIQGEGQFAGTPTVFVRTTGCNLRCWFCDTGYTSWSPEGQQRDWPSVLEEVAAIDCRHVDITGGEPMLQRDLVPLSRALAARGRFVTIETAGTVDRPVHADLMSISPKLGNSTPEDPRWSARHQQRRDRPEVIRRLLDDYRCQFKFVIDHPVDLEEVDRYVQRFPDLPAEAIWLMPQATTAEELQARHDWLAAEASRRGFRVSPRLHIELFGNQPGT